MNIPLVDLQRQSKGLVPLIQKGIANIISTSDFILGKEVENFENNFANYVGTKYCIGVASGTDALMLSLKAIGIEKGDEIIIPAMSFIATASPVIFLGATPVFVDINPETRLIDEAKIEKAITPRTKAIIPVHLYGQVCDMESIIKIAKKYKLVVLEDACQAHGSILKNKKAGTFGSLAAFSFYPGKNLGAFGDAGAIVTSDSKLAKKIKSLRDHGQEEKYEHSVLGYNSRLDSIQAHILNIKLNYLDKWNNERRKSAKTLKKLLNGLPIDLPKDINGHIYNYHLFVIETQRRDNLLSFLKSRKIHCGIHYPLPLHLQKAFSYLGYKKGDFPNAEKLARTCLSLPLFPGITKKELEFISKELHSFFSK
ncbi:DegT/DnrJ/EryC1/StrS family aminotransferase [Candidatus Parcubacteria bacterium]|nr:MAG: DegT/DnrJ/EryC1/StrS family aminotransferase [Candidatus Parcubacteria bacterium]